MAIARRCRHSLIYQRCPPCHKRSIRTPGCWTGTASISSGPSMQKVLSYSISSVTELGTSGEDVASRLRSTLWSGRSTCMLRLSSSKRCRCEASWDALSLMRSLSNTWHIRHGHSSAYGTGKNDATAPQRLLCPSPGRRELQSFFCRKRGLYQCLGRASHTGRSLCLPQKRENTSFDYPLFSLVFIQYILYCIFIT